MKKEDLRIVFLGTPEFAVESLDRIVSEGYNVVGVVTMPDKPAGRGHHMLQSDVKKYALAHSLPLLQPVNLKDPDFIEELRALNADLFIVIAFRMLPEVVWSMPPLGTFNLHASLLPRYRGAAPINRAVMNGDTVTGVTTFFLRHEIDTGDIISQQSITIAPDENVGSVHDRLMHLGADLTLDTIRHIIAGDLAPIPQESLLTPGEQPTPAPKIFKETCRIDWNRSASELHNHIRGLSPYPAAWTTIDTADPSVQPLQLKIFSARPTTRHATAPGRIVVEGNRMFIDASDCALEILEVQLAGKRRMEVAPFLIGTKFPLTHAI